MKRLRSLPLRFFISSTFALTSVCYAWKQDMGMANWCMLLTLYFELGWLYR